MTRLLIVADDLTGAAETAGAVAAVTGASPLLRFDRVGDAHGQVVAVDTGSRALAPARAAEATLHAVRRRHPDSLVYKKIDSQLRGNIAAEVAALAAAGMPMIAAAAVPRIGRTVRGGVVHIDGVPAGSVAAALGVRCQVVPADGGLVTSIASALASGAVPVIDSETEEDLRLVAEAVTRIPAPAVVLAAGGLARALAPMLGLAAEEGRFAPGADRVVVVVGTRAPSAVRQVGRLAVRHVGLGPGDRIQLDGSDAVVTLDDAATWDDAALESALGDIGVAIRDLPGRTDLVLTGGDTARRVLDAQGITELQVEVEIEDGAVLSLTPAGSAVVTRPGSFGDDDGLVRLHAYLKGGSV